MLRRLVEIGRGQRNDRHIHGRRSWKDNLKAKTIAATVSSLVIAALIAVLVLALLKANGK